MSSFRYPAYYRLLKAVQYKKVFKEGRRITTRNLRAVILANDTLHPRLGLVVAKKNIAKAHQRNYFKRLNREIFRLHQHKLLSLDMVILTQGLPKGATDADLHREIAALWKKLLALSAPPKTNG